MRLSTVNIPETEIETISNRMLPISSFAVNWYWGEVMWIKLNAECETIRIHIERWLQGEIYSPKTVLFFFRAFQPETDLKINRMRKFRNSLSLPSASIALSALRDRKIIFFLSIFSPFSLHSLFPLVIFPLGWFHLHSEFNYWMRAVSIHCVRIELLLNWEIKLTRQFVNKQIQKCKFPNVNLNEPRIMKREIESERAKNIANEQWTNVLWSQFFCCVHFFHIICHQFVVRMLSESKGSKYSFQNALATVISRLLLLRCSQIAGHLILNRE